jgi:hypothetical protein
MDKPITVLTIFEAGTACHVPIGAKLRRLGILEASHSKEETQFP